MNNCIIYSHSSYIDILRVQTDFFHKKNYFNLTLFINSNCILPTDITSKFDKIFFYEESLTYPSRILQCLHKYNEEVFLFIHDIDILLEMDNEVISKMYNMMADSEIDRIDLKQTEKIISNENILVNDELSLIKQTDPNKYIYNVNPSIWKKKSFSDILSRFSNRTYRDIEMIDVQNYCTKYNIYKLYSSLEKKCGYFNCSVFFVFLHISHSGKLLELNESFTTMYNQSYYDVKNEFIDIKQNYKLQIVN
jgi:hypothetical protein